MELTKDSSPGREENQQRITQYMRLASLTQNLPKEKKSAKKEFFLFLLCHKKGKQARSAGLPKIVQAESNGLCYC